MSGIRRMRRTKPRRLRRKEAPKRLRLCDVLLVVGLVAVAMGGLLGAREYQIYRVGRPEQLRETRLGMRHLPAVSPGEPGRRASAYADFATAGVGVALSVFALAMRAIEKRGATQKTDQRGARVVRSRRIACCVNRGGRVWYCPSWLV
jgi:hypothetical protein